MMNNQDRRLHSGFYRNREVLDTYIQFNCRTSFNLARNTYNLVPAGHTSLDSRSQGRGLGAEVMVYSPCPSDPDGQNDSVLLCLIFLDYRNNSLSNLQNCKMFAKVALACLAGAAQAAVPSDKITSLPGWPQSEQVRP